MKKAPGAIKVVGKVLQKSGSPELYEISVTNRENMHKRVDVNKSQLSTLSQLTVILQSDMLEFPQAFALPHVRPDIDREGRKITMGLDCLRAFFHVVNILLHGDRTDPRIWVDYEGVEATLRDGRIHSEMIQR